jgi:hypothetical protein
MVIGGDFTAFNGTNRNYIAKLSSLGVLDPNFNPLPDKAVYATLIQPDGRIVIGGQFTQINSVSLPGFARLNSDGSTDSSFDVGSGFTATYSPSGIRALALQPDGKVVMGSDYGTVKGVPFKTVTRFYAGLPGLPGTVQLITSSSITLEGSSKILTVTRSGGSYGPISVNYATIPGTATNGDYTATTGTLTWTNGETSSKSVMISIAADGLAEPDETFTLNLGTPLGGTFINSPSYTTVSITTGYSIWKQNYFTPLEAIDPQISGDDADPDGDGMANIFEYASNTDPRSPNTLQKPTLKVLAVGGTNYLGISYRRYQSAPDLLYTPQAVGLLNGTFTNGPIAVGSPIDNFDGTETVTWRDTVAMTNSVQRFMRLQVIRVP